MRLRSADSSYQRGLERYSASLWRSSASERFGLMWAQVTRIALNKAIGATYEPAKAVLAMETQTQSSV